MPDSPRAIGQDIQHWFLRERDFRIVDRLLDVAEQKRATPAQIALAWVLSKVVITTPIVGISKMEHLEQAVEALEIELSSEETAFLEELYRPRNLIQHHGGRPVAGDKVD